MRQALATCNGRTALALSWTRGSARLGQSAVAQRLAQAARRAARAMPSPHPANCAGPLDPEHLHGACRKVSTPPTSCFDRPRNLPGSIRASSATGWNILAAAMCCAFWARECRPTECTAILRGNSTPVLSSVPRGCASDTTPAGNSIKLYDKQGSVLRAETTINRPEVFRVYRTAESHPEAPLRWMVLRRGIADIHRRGQHRPKPALS